MYKFGSLIMPSFKNKSYNNEIYIKIKPHIINIHEAALVFDIFKIDKKVTKPTNTNLMIYKISSTFIVFSLSAFITKSTELKFKR
jgi:hypothetical protein